jgi:ferritin-like metal-binding protein YciE
MENLKDLFLDELADMYDAENRISKALPKMAKAATSSELKNALLKHQKETLGQIENLKRVFAAFDKKAKGKECKATVGLLEEGDEIVEDNKGEPTLNAGIISACQKVEHYEIASYGCLIEWARLLGNEQAVSLLAEILDEEKNANETLTELAEEANAEANADKDEDGPEETGTSKNARSRVAPASLSERAR